MLADLVGVDGFGIDIEVAGDAGAEPGGVENSAGADDFLGREAGEFVSVVSEDVHGIGDDEEDTAEAGGHDLLNHAFQNIDIFLQEFHAGLAGTLGGAGSNHDDVAVASVFISAI